MAGRPGPQRAKGFRVVTMNRKERRAAAKNSTVRAAGGGTVSEVGDIEALFETARLHHQAGEIAEAQQICRIILARKPKHVPSLILSGISAQQAGRNQVAIRILREAIALDDRGASAHDAIGLAYEAIGQRGLAVRHFGQAIARGLSNVELNIRKIPTVGDSMA